MRTTEPTRIEQGEQIEWMRTFNDYPATEWTLQYRYRGPSVGFNIDATADGENFATVITAAVSQDIAVGDWLWQAWVTNIADTDDTQMIVSGSLKALQGFAADATDEIDLRTPAKITLDVIDAAIAGQMSASILEYEVSTPAGSQKVKRMMASELISARKYWAAIVANEVAAERVRNGKPFGTQIGVRFRDV